VRGAVDAQRWWTLSREDHPSHHCRDDDHSFFEMMSRPHTEKRRKNLGSACTGASSEAVKYFLIDRQSFTINTIKVLRWKEVP
jgi:hypothetical protein